MTCKAHEKIVLALCSVFSGLALFETTFLVGGDYSPVEVIALFALGIGTCDGSDDPFLTVEEGKEQKLDQGLSTHIHRILRTMPCDLCLLKLDT